MKYYNNCVNWPNDDVENGLIPMIDNSIEITRRTFLKYIDKTELSMIERSLGYDKHWKHGLTMAGDLYVSYHHSKLHGNVVYYFKYSAIEYIFN